MTGRALQPGLHQMVKGLPLLLSVRRQREQLSDRAARRAANRPPSPRISRPSEVLPSSPTSHPHINFVLEASAGIGSGKC